MSVNEPGSVANEEFGVKQRQALRFVQELSQSIGPTASHARNATESEASRTTSIRRFERDLIAMKNLDLRGP